MYPDMSGRSSPRHRRSRSAPTQPLKAHRARAKGSAVARVRPGEAALQAEVSAYERNVRAAAEARARHLGHAELSAADVRAAKVVLRQTGPESSPGAYLALGAQTLSSVTAGFAVALVQAPSSGLLDGLVVSGVVTLALLIAALKKGWRPKG